MQASVTVSAAVRSRGRDRDLHATLAALGAQDVLVAGRAVAASFHEAVLEAVGSGAEWIWLLDAGAEPRPSALAEMLAALEARADLPAPALVAGKLVGPDGRIVPSRAPWPPLLDREVVIAAARHHLVSLRMARWGSMLVHRDVVARHGAPRADFAGADDLEWTARILKDDYGYLAPRSVADIVDAPGPGGAEDVRDRARMVRGTAWVAQEPVWFAFMLAVDLSRVARRRPARLPRLVVAALSGARAGA